MRRFISTLIVILFYATSYGQFVAKLEVDEPIEGLCNAQEVYALFPSMQGQVEAVCPISKADLLERLNTEVTFLKDNPKYKDKGMIGLLINCNNEIVKCKMDLKTKSATLDAQIEAVFNTLGQWTSAKLNGNIVDSSRLFSFKIKNGKFTF